MPSGVKWWVVDTVQSFLLPPYGHIITQALSEVKSFFSNIVTRLIEHPAILQL